MTDLDPKIWENETLGSAAYNERLDRLEKQQQEDRAAKVEGREPREVVVDNTYPDWTPDVNPRTGTVPSNYQTVHFADEQPNDVPTDSGRPEEDAGTVAEETDKGPEESPETPDDDSGLADLPDSSAFSGTGSPDGESESADSDSTEEGNSTQWT